MYLANGEEQKQKKKSLRPGTCKPGGVGIYGADLFVRGRATYLQATPGGGEGEYGVASGWRKELLRGGAIEETSIGPFGRGSTGGI